MSPATILVQPASARRESLAVGALCLTILVLAAGTIALRGRDQAVRELAPWQLDGRVDLNPAEQGILADLTIAAGEIEWLAENGALPAVAELAAEGLPPFAPSASDGLRGGHLWSLADGAYLGRPDAPDTAGSFLLIPGEPPVIWLAEGAKEAPADLSQAALADQGWRQVVSQYDASVTRHDHGNTE